MLIVSQFFLHTASIGLGSNLGDSRSILCKAWQALGTFPGITTIAISSPHITEPVGMATENWFVNAVGLLRTPLPPLEILSILQQVESCFGRRRDPKHPGYQDRTLDLDLLLFDDEYLNSQRLVVPHPAMHERGFVLVPLAEIGDFLVHPLLQKSIKDLLGELKAKGLAGDVRRGTWGDDGV